MSLLVNFLENLHFTSRYIMYTQPPGRLDAVYSLDKRYVITVAVLMTLLQTRIGGSTSVFIMAAYVMIDSPSVRITSRTCCDLEMTTVASGQYFFTSCHSHADGMLGIIQPKLQIYYCTHKI